MSRPDLIRCDRVEIPIQPIRCNRQIVLGVRRYLVAPLAPCTNAFSRIIRSTPLLASWKPTVTQFSDHSRTAVDPLEFGMNRLDQRQHLSLREAFTIRLATTLPQPVTTRADI